MEQQREYWIDLAKALLIICVVLGHACPSGWEHQTIYAFHMPAFFILSGYLYKAHSWKQTARSLFIPILFFGIINLIYSYALNIGTNGLSLQAIGAYLGKSWQPFFVANHGAYHTPFTGQWFLIVLFLCRCLMGDLKMFDWTTKWRWQIMVVCILFTWLQPMIWEAYAAIQDWHLAKVIVCWPFLIIGTYIKEFKEKMLSLKAYQLLILLAAGLFLTIQNKAVDIYESSYGASPLLMYLNATLITLLICNGLSRLEKRLSLLYRPAEILSRGTLVILGCHSIIISLTTILLNHIGMGSSRLNYIPATLATIIITYPIIIFLLDKAPVLAGKRKVKRELKNKKGLLAKR